VPDHNPSPALSLEHIGKRFGTVAALSDASLSVVPGTVQALLGENGAGKTTLMHIAFGLLHADSGSIRVFGKPVRIDSPADALHLGLGMVHQHFTHVHSMTVAENVALGGRGTYSARSARERVLAIGRETGLILDPDARAGELPVSAQQRLEIVKALARGARILILDEPTAVLAPMEVDDLMAFLRRYAAGGGTAVLITHKLREALAVADGVTVLRAGYTVLDTPAARATEESLTRAMVGAVSPSLLDAPRAASPSLHVIEERVAIIAARDLVLSDERGVRRVSGVSLEVHAGEIVGIAGVEGAGQRELLRALAGRLTPDLGTLRLPQQIAFVPEDRHRDALVLDFPLYENVALRDAGSSRGIIDWPNAVARTSELIDRFDIRAPGAHAAARELSGGNQQKLILARELSTSPQALVVENPTRGLDITATAAVHRHLAAAREAGTAVVLYSSDLDEVLTLADRVIVMFAGKAREIGKGDRESLGRALVGLGVTAPPEALPPARP
jgi:simple sugar transport system ATP-binding protein